MSMLADRRSVGRSSGSVGRPHGRRAAGRTEAPAPRIRRTPELIVVAVGLVIALVVMGGFALVINQLDESGFAETVMPSLFGDAAGEVEVGAAHEAARTLGAWFGVSFVVMLALCAAGIVQTRVRPERRAPGWWFLAAGVVCLVGSQLILYPIAFLFFVAAGLYAVRRPASEGSTR
ncbi:hypothetical protein ACXET9_08885 [Brachybacterium sp. DNPG3]